MIKISNKLFTIGWRGDLNSVKVQKIERWGITVIEEGRWMVVVQLLSLVHNAGYNSNHKQTYVKAGWQSLYYRCNRYVP